MILVSGYYGYHNSGDEAILASLCQDLVSLGIKRTEIIVLSGNPADTMAVHQVQAIPRYNFPAIIQALRRCELLISGGGSLFQDASSWRTIPYYLGIIKMALASRVKVLAYAQGIGPVSSKFYQKRIASVFTDIDGITVRDEASAQLLNDWGLGKELIKITADPVFNLRFETEQKQGITLNLRPYDHWRQDFPQWIGLLRHWIETLGWSIDFIGLGPGDNEMGEELKKVVPGINHRQASNWFEAAQLMGGNEICLAMRLHGIIFAALGGSLPIGLCYDPKVRAIGSQLGIPVRTISPEQSLTEVVLELKKDKTICQQRLRVRLDGLRSRSLENRLVIASVLS